MSKMADILDAQRGWETMHVQDEAIIRKYAEEALKKCADAVLTLSHNLHSIGYPWAANEKIASEELNSNILKIEKTIGSTVPKILCLFWKTVGGISWVDLMNYQHVEFWKDQGIFSPSQFCDGLHVDPCNKAWTAFICDDYQSWKENNSEVETRFLLSLSPDGYHKDNISGGDSYGVYAGAAWKPVWENFRWSGVSRPLAAPASPPDFLSYLRITILECAGFPALLGLAAFEPIKERLLEGVQIF